MLTLHNVKDVYETPEWLKEYINNPVTGLLHDRIDNRYIHYYGNNLKLNGEFTLQQLKDLVAFAEAKAKTTSGVSDGKDSD